MNTAEKIAVMQAFEDGKKIDFRSDAHGLDWREAIDPDWDWVDCDYRLKPKPATLEDRVKAEYPEFDVVMLEWDEDNNILGFGDNSNWGHARAQSMKGFYRYAYIHPDGDFDTSTDAVMMWDKGVTLHPIAVLFSRGDK